jgi:hypothetical protein
LTSLNCTLKIASRRGRNQAAAIASGIFS